MYWTTIVTTLIAAFGLGWASLITWGIALAKEAFDLFRKTNNLKNVANDIIRDAIGWGCGVIVAIL